MVVIISRTSSNFLQTSSAETYFCEMYLATWPQFLSSPLSHGLYIIITTSWSKVYSKAWTLTTRNCISSWTHEVAWSSLGVHGKERSCLLYVCAQGIVPNAKLWLTIKKGTSRRPRRRRIASSSLPPAPSTHDRTFRQKNFFVLGSFDLSFRFWPSFVHRQLHMSRNYLSLLISVYF